jgi:hypothetical protein
MPWLILAFLLSTALYMLLLRRIAPYRVDGERRPSLRGLIGGDALRADRYNAEGRHLLPWLIASSLVSTLSFLAIGVSLVCANP